MKTMTTEVIDVMAKPIWFFLKKNKDCSVNIVMVDGEITISLIRGKKIKRCKIFDLSNLTQKVENYLYLK